ncbi:hypothetical protein FOA52_005068 [Chlamydomonas sp. UWO 241]|nr:hypothetical protein FOA52_005068 [Chlamydomonas sp. UWO 241]
MAATASPFSGQGVQQGRYLEREPSRHAKFEDESGSCVDSLAGTMPRKSTGGTTGVGQLPSAAPSRLQQRASRSCRSFARRLPSNRRIWTPTAVEISLG